MPEFSYGNRPEHGNETKKDDGEGQSLQTGMSDGNDGSNSGEDDDTNKENPNLAEETMPPVPQENQDLSKESFPSNESRQEFADAERGNLFEKESSGKEAAAEYSPPKLEE